MDLVVESGITKKKNVGTAELMYVLNSENVPQIPAESGRKSSGYLLPWNLFEERRYLISAW